jgi:hypothetical protein
VRLDADLENLRSAIGWAHQHDEDLEVELAGATWFFLFMRGLLREALGYLVHAIETAQNAPSLDQSELLYGAAYVALRTGDYEAVEQWCEQRLGLGRVRGDAPVIAQSLVGLALAADARLDFQRARTLFVEAAEVARDCGDTRTLGMAVSNLGRIAILEGDAETARLYYQQGLELFRELSDAHAEAASLGNLASLALRAGDTDDAVALLATPCASRVASEPVSRSGIACSTGPKSPRNAMKRFALRDCLARPTRFARRSGTAPPTCPSRNSARGSPTSSRERPRTGRSPVGRSLDDARRRSRARAVTRLFVTPTQGTFPHTRAAERRLAWKRAI